MGNQNYTIYDDKKVIFYKPDFSNLACFKAYLLKRTTSGTAIALSNSKAVVHSLKNDEDARGEGRVNEMDEGFAVREIRAVEEVLDDNLAAIRNMVALRKSLLIRNLKKDLVFRKGGVHSEHLRVGL